MDQGTLCITESISLEVISPVAASSTRLTRATIRPQTTMRKRWGLPLRKQMATMPPTMPENSRWIISADSAEVPVAARPLNSIATLKDAATAAGAPNKPVSSIAAMVTGAT